MQSLQLQLMQLVAEGMVEEAMEAAAALAWKTGSAVNGQAALIICKQEFATTSIIAAQYSISRQKQNFAQQKNQQEKQQKKAMKIIIKNQKLTINIICRTLPVSY